MAPADMKYDEALKRLEKLVDELDTPELELESRLKKFEEGTKLARLLLKKLDHAKKKVELLVKANVSETALIPFDDNDSDETQTENSAS